MLLESQKPADKDFALVAGATDTALFIADLRAREKMYKILLYISVASVWLSSFWGAAEFHKVIPEAEGDTVFLSAFVFFVLAMAIGGAVLLQKTRPKKEIAVSRQS